MTNPDTDSLVQSALAIASAEETPSLESIKQAVSIAKTDAIRQKVIVSAQNQQKKLRLAFFQSISAVLIPIVSLMALVGTIAMQAYQLHLTRVQADQQADAARQERVDLAWTDFLKSFGTYSKDYYSDPSFIPRLRFFMDQPSYRSQATDIAKNVMGSVSDRPGFERLFDRVFGHIDPNNISDAVDVLRLLKASFESARTECEALSVQVDGTMTQYLGFCSDYSGLTQGDVTKRVEGKAQGPRILKLRQLTFDLGGEESFVSVRMAKYLAMAFDARNPRRSRSVVDLSGAYIQTADLSHVDFTTFLLDGTVFDGVNLTAAVIAPSAGWNNPDMRASNWWQARAVAPDLFAKLISEDYPYYAGTKAEVFNITPEAYVARVRELCKPVQDACKALKFGDKTLQNQ